MPALPALTLAWRRVRASAFWHGVLFGRTSYTPACATQRCIVLTVPWRGAVFPLDHVDFAALSQLMLPCSGGKGAYTCDAGHQPATRSCAPGYRDSAKAARWVGTVNLPAALA